MIRVRPDNLELLLLAAGASVLAVQLFIPPSVGLADNGDFVAVCDLFSLAHVRGSADNFEYFAPRYWFSPDKSGVSRVPSSEAVLTAGPIWIARGLKSEVFDIRWLGVLNALLFLVAFYALLVHLRGWKPWQRLLLGAAALWVFGDVAYVAYFNSFFADAAALLGVLLIVPIALRAACDSGPGEASLLFLAFAALLFIGAKPQHAVVGCVVGMMVLIVMRRKLLALLVLCAVWAVATATPRGLRVNTAFNLIFSRILLNSPTPQQDLAQLGLGAEDVRYIGMHAGDPGSAITDPQLWSDFQHHTGGARILWFYLRHPVRTLRILAADLHFEAFQIRPPTLGNFPREQGQPPGTLARHFNSWSVLRTQLYIRWWWHIAVWYVLFLGVGLRLARRSHAARVALAVAAMALGEFLATSLGVGVDVGRHLIVFHLLTDVTILMALAWLISSGPLRAIRRDTAGARSDLLPVNS